jgi:SAM-dependent methyltransferase
VNSNPVLAGYEAAAEVLIPAWEQLSPAQIYAPVRAFLPAMPGHVLDVGAGTGRDAEWFAGQGHHVIAAEPVAAFRAVGQGRQGVTWCDDSLPGLKGLCRSGRVFDLITANGVLHHLAPDQRLQAMTTLCSLMKPDSRMILSLRHGPTPADRPGFPVNTDAFVRGVTRLGLSVLYERRGCASLQAGNRANGVSWDWLVFSAG